LRFDAPDGVRVNSEGDRDHTQALVALHDGLADRLLFPAVSWKTSWGARSLPFPIQKRRNGCIRRFFCCLRTYWSHLFNRRAAHSMPRPRLAKANMGGAELPNRVCLQESTVTDFANDKASKCVAVPQLGAFAVQKFFRER